MIKYIHKLCLALFLETFSAEARRVCFNAQRLPKLVFKISFFKVLKHLTLLKSILTNQCTYALFDINDKCKSENKEDVGWNYNDIPHIN